MSYTYEEFKQFIWSDEGQRAFIEVRDFALECWKTAGAATAGKLLDRVHFGDSWQSMAVVDRLFDIGDATVLKPYDNCAWQHRVFLPAKERYL